MPIETAIRKITSDPARKFGLTGRGEIKEGNYADLTCFTNAAEIRFTVVNGKVAMKDGEFQGRFPGKTLRHKDRT
jgi:N-acyl-D-amino-acid deacylase